MNVEVVVPDKESLGHIRDYVGPNPGARLATTSSERPARRILAVWLPSLDVPSGRLGLKNFFVDGWRHEKTAPAVFIEGVAAARRTGAFLRAVVEASSWAGRQHLDPYIAPGSAAVRRLILARKADAETRLIASAEVEDGRLVVWSCEPRRFELAASEIPALASLTTDELQDFEVSTSGSRIHWNAGDIDLDLDTVRAHSDPAVRREHNSQMRRDAALFAKAIRLFREEKRLGQTDIPNLSDRQIRRIELGQTIPHSSTLAKLAAAHRMSMNDYMAELARRSC